MHESTSRGRTSIVSLYDADMTDGLNYFEEANVAQWLAESCIPVLCLTDTAAPVLVNTQMVTKQTAVTTVDSAALKPAIFSALLELAGVPEKCVAIMNESLHKLASVVSYRYVGCNETVSVDGLEPLLMSDFSSIFSSLFVSSHQPLDIAL